MERIACRVCLESSRRLQSIFASRATFDVTAFIKDLCNISILENDGYSDQMCRMCLDKLQAAHDIRLKCINSDRRLRNVHEASRLNEKPPNEKPEVLEVKDECFDCAGDMEQNRSVVNLSMSQDFESFVGLESTLEQQRMSSELKEEVKLLDDDPDPPHHDEVVQPNQDDLDPPNHDETQSLHESNVVVNTVAKRKRSKPPERPHMCSVCGKTFSSSGHLRSHERIHNDSKDFICNSCGKKFLTKSYLNRHLKSHLNERNYKCKVCEKGFNTSTTLGYHFRLVHSGETRFQCTFCNKGFPLKIQLISHTRSHSGEKPHKCDECDKKYSHKIDLKRHKMLHSGNKPYKCPYCERTFTKKSNMDCHIPTHTGEKPYKCKICLKEFRQPCPYKKHLQTHSEIDAELPTKSFQNLLT